MAHFFVHVDAIASPTTADATVPSYETSVSVVLCWSQFIWPGSYSCGGSAENHFWIEKRPSTGTASVETAILGQRVTAPGALTPALLLTLVDEDLHRRVGRPGLVSKEPPVSAEAGVVGACGQGAEGQQLVVSALVGVPLQETRRRLRH